MIELFDYQRKAVEELRPGSILCGGVGSGKSITAIAYYMEKICDGVVKPYREMQFPRDLYIITTAKKRDSLEWDEDLSYFLLSKVQDYSHSGVKVVVDSWNNIKKYKDVIGAFFIFDEQRVVGSGTWVKTFLNISRKNQWILLSATPGDEWKDYIPVFVANGMYRNKSDFQAKHCVFSRYAKYPKIEKYIHEDILNRNLSMIMVIMKDQRKIERHILIESIGYNHEKMDLVARKRWDPYDNCPIRETGKLCYLMRRVANEGDERITKAAEIIRGKRKLIVFYNFNYELYILQSLCDHLKVKYAEWNGFKHEKIPVGRNWVYLVQYSAGAEGWNCITTDTILFFSLNYSYRMTEQASGRIDRVNSPYVDLYYYYLISDAPIDQSIYKALTRKEKFNEDVFLRNSGIT